MTEIRMATDRPKPYDLEERTALFGEDVICFAKRIPLSQVNRSLIDQVVRAGTGIGANFCEADDSESKRDFKHKIRLCRKESRETKHWMRMIAAAEPSVADDARKLWKEAKELNLIFEAIARGRIESDRPK